MSGIYKNTITPSDSQEISIRTKYFRWIVKGLKLEQYYLLLDCLNQIEYIPSKSMDYNRYEDGLSYRIRFADDLNLNHDEVRAELNGPCTMLEMMGALALRTEEDTYFYMEQYGRWFQVMLESLGLTYMTDNNFDKFYVYDACANFMSENYEKNGKGGLFTISNPDIDMRKLEIWQQLQRYLVETDL